MAALAKAALARHWKTGGLAPRAKAGNRRVRRYLLETSEPKLHIGCGDHLLAGWLNTDRRPRRPGVLRLDATRRFPFPADTFACVYSEHVLGSLAFDGAEAMLRECRRVLVPGGTLRIATPDLAFLADLHGPQLSPAQERYLEWFRAQTNTPAGGAGFVVNGYINAWKLEVVYDEAMLRAALAASGFPAATRCGLTDSAAPALRHLANEARLPAGLLRLETLVLEANKPPAGARPGSN